MWAERGTIIVCFIKNSMRPDEGIMPLLDRRGRGLLLHAQVLKYSSVLKTDNLLFHESYY